MNVRPAWGCAIASLVLIGVVGLHLQRGDFYIHRQHVRILHHVVRIAGRNVDVLPAEAKHRRRARRRVRAEVQADRWRDAMGGLA